MKLKLVVLAIFCVLVIIVIIISTQFFGQEIKENLVVYIGAPSSITLIDSSYRRWVSRPKNSGWIETCAYFLEMEQKFVLTPENPRIDQKMQEIINTAIKNRSEISLLGHEMSQEGRSVFYPLQIEHSQGFLDLFENIPELK